MFTKITKIVAKKKKKKKEENVKSKTNKRNIKNIVRYKKAWTLLMVWHTVETMLRINIRNILDDKSNKFRYNLKI